MGDFGGERKVTDQPLAHERIELRAFQEGWKLPQEKRDEIGCRLVDVVTGPKRYRVRYVIAAAKALIGADLKQQEIDLSKAQSSQTDAEALMKETARLVAERPRSGIGGPPGEVVG